MNSHEMAERGDRYDVVLPKSRDHHQQQRRCRRSPGSVARQEPDEPGAHNGLAAELRIVSTDIDRRVARHDGEIPERTYRSASAATNQNANGEEYLDGDCNQRDERDHAPGE